MSINLQCENCGMIFENQQHFQKHKQKFCAGSNYADINSLEQKFKRSFAGTNFLSQPNNQQRSGLKKIGRMDQDDYMFEIEKQKLKNKNKQQQQYQQLLKQIKRQETIKAQTKIQKDNILKQLRKLNKQQIDALAQQKQQQLKLLNKKKRQIKLEEQSLQNQLNQFLQKKKQFNYENEDQKIQYQKNTNDLKQKQRNAQNLQQDFIYQQGKKISELQLRRQLFEGEKKILQHNIKAAKDKKFQQMLPSKIPSSYQSNPYTFKTQPFDKIDEYRKLMNDNLNKSHAEQKLNYLRNNLDPMAQLNIIEKRRIQLQQLKKEYEMNGGDDPNFFKSLSNLQSKYQNAKKSNVQNIAMQKNNLNKKELSRSNVNYNQTSINNSIVKQNLNTQELRNSNQSNKNNPNYQFNNLSYNNNPNNPYKINQKYMTNIVTSNNISQKKQPKYLVNPNSFTNKDKLVLEQNIAPDQTIQQRILSSVMAQQYDSLQILSKLPKDSQLYKIKYKQYLQITKIRQNIVKQAHQQRLLKIKKQFQMEKKLDIKDKDNQIWVDNVRKDIIRKRNLQMKSNNIDNKSKFNIQLQLISGLPFQTQKCKIIFTLLKDQKRIGQSQQLPQKQCQPKQDSAKCPIVQNLQMILALQPSLKGLFEIYISNSSIFKPYGWAILQITNSVGNLALSNFQLQIFEPPVLQNKKMKIDSYLYLKVFLNTPSDQQYINPTQVSKKTMNQLFQKIESNTPPPPTNFNQNQQNQNNKILQVPRNIPIPSYTKNQNKNLQNNQKYNMNQEKYGMNNKSPQLKYNGYKITVINASTTTITQNLWIQLSLYQEDKKLSTDKGKSYDFITDYRSTAKQQKKNLKSQNSKLKIARFDEAFVINEDLNHYYKKSQKQLYLIVKMLTKDIDNKSIQIGWYCLKLTNFRELRLGRVKLNLYADPIKFLPFDMNQAKSKLEDTIQLAMDEFELDNSFVPVNILQKTEQSIFRKRDQPKLKINQQDQSQSQQNSLKRINQFKNIPSPINQDAESINLNNQTQKQGTSNNIFNNKTFNSTKSYISNRQQQKLKIPEGEIKNFDFQISFLRTVPSKIGVVKLFVNYLDSKNRNLIDTQEVLPLFKSSTFNQQFDYCKMIRKTKLSASTIVLINLVSYNEKNGSTGTLGFSIFPFFVNSKGQQITKEEQTQHYLHKGCYQIPVFWSYNKNFININNQINKYPKIPCLSLLIKITPNEKNEQFQIPEYNSGNFNTKYFIVNPYEQRLFNILTKRTKYLCQQSIKKFLELKNLKNKYNETEMEEFLDKKLELKSNMNLVSINSLSNYDPKIGFKLTLDSVTNLPGKNFYFATVCLCPPGFYYKAQKLDLIFIKRVNMDSHKEFITFLDGSYTFNQNYNKNLCWVIEIVQVVMEQVGKIEFNTFGYAIIPVFQPDSETVNAGTFRISLISGQFPETQLENMFKDLYNTKKSIQQNTKMLKKVLLNIKITNLYFQDQFKMEIFNVPVKVNEDQKVKKLLPKNVSQQDFQKSLQSHINKQYQIT